MPLCRRRGLEVIDVYVCTCLVSFARFLLLIFKIESALNSAFPDLATVY